MSACPIAAIAVVPSAPVLVPELAGGELPELAELRVAVAEALAPFPRRWVAIGTATADGRFGPDAAAGFGGYGVDLPVALGPDVRPATISTSAPAAVPPMTPVPSVSPLPLCALMTGWLRGWCDPAARATVHAHDAGLAGPAAVARGRALGERLGRAGEPVGLLVVADGANALHPTAPGGYDPAAVTAQETFAAAVAGGDVDRLAALPPAILGRAAFAVLAGVLGERPAETRGLYAGAPFGVGYCVAAWRP